MLRETSEIGRNSQSQRDFLDRRSIAATNRGHLGGPGRAANSALPFYRGEFM
jgi:hypothetical protein